MDKLIELLGKITDFISGLNVTKITVSATMIIQLIDALQEAFEDFGDDEELTEEQQQAIYDKYHASLTESKAEMKELIAAAKAGKA